MNCEHPLKTWVLFGDTRVPGPTVPCGRCISCRIQKTREWSCRLIHELSQYGNNAVFITLTYDDDNLPIDNGLDKREFQLFMKRLRKEVAYKKNGSRKIKYFACGEYGELHGRSHYHAIIFGMVKDDKDIINKCWNKGLIYIGTVTYNSIRYVAGYIYKKYNGEKAKEVYGVKQPPFQLCSKGIGYRWLLENEDYVLQNYCFTVNGVRHGLSRYYVKKLGDKIDKDKLNSMTLDRLKIKYESYDESGVDVLDYWKLEKDLRVKKALERDFNLERKSKGKM